MFQEMKYNSRRWINFLLLGFTLQSWLPLSAQKIGLFTQVSGSYLNQTDEASRFTYANEFSLRTALGVNIGKYWTVAAKYQQVFYQQYTSPYYRASVAGPFVRFGGLIGEHRFGVFLESGLMFGNYCTCQKFLYLANKEPGLVYLSWGGGAEYRLGRGIFLEASVVGHNILNYPGPRYAYITYLVGFNFRLRPSSLR